MFTLKKGSVLCRNASSTRHKRGPRIVLQARQRNYREAQCRGRSVHGPLQQSQTGPHNGRKVLATEAQGGALTRPGDVYLRSLFLGNPIVLDFAVTHAQQLKYTDKVRNASWVTAGSFAEHYSSMEKGRQRREAVDAGCDFTAMVGRKLWRLEPQCFSSDPQSWGTSLTCLVWVIDRRGSHEQNLYGAERHPSCAFRRA